MSNRPASVGGAGAVASVQRSGDRFHTRADGRDSWHSFAFGPHHDPANSHHGLLIAHNEETLASSAGFSAHAHREVEIVTWVLSGTLTHEDSTGHRGTIHPGLAQRMSAGTGIVHSESNDPHAPPVHFVQMWLPADRAGRDPGYAQAEIDPAGLSSGLQPIVSGLTKYRDRAPITLGNAGAALLAASLPAGAQVQLPDAPYVHLFVPSGEVVVEGLGRLHPGDTARFSGGAGNRIIACGSSQLLVWEMIRPAFG